MKKSFNYVATSTMLLSALMLQACPPTQNQNPTASPTTTATPSATESVKPVESASVSPSVAPSMAPSTTPSIIPSAMPSVVPSAMPIATASPTAFTGKTYKYDFVLKSGTAQAYLTTLSPTKGRLLVNFSNIDAVPSKVALLDSFGNELALTTSFNVAKNGNVMFDYLLKDGQDMTEIVIYVNGVAYKVSVKNGVVYSEVIPSPVSPNPTPTPVVDAPLPQTFIPSASPSYFPCYFCG